MRPHLYQRPCPSVRWLVGRSVGRSVHWSVGNAFVKIDENGLLRILNDLDRTGREKKRDEEAGSRRDEEKGGMRREEGRGGPRDGEEGGMKRVKEGKSC